MAVTPQPEAAKAGVDVLAAGGDAVKHGAQGYTFVALDGILLHGRVPSGSTKP